MNKHGDVCCCDLCNGERQGWYKYYDQAQKNAKEEKQYFASIEDKLNVLLKNAEYAAQKEAARQQAEKAEALEKERFMGSTLEEEQSDVISVIKNRTGIGRRQDDAINPSHYRFSDLEPVEVTERWNLGYNLGTVLKYLARAGKKDPSKEIEDLKKARWYLDRQIANLEKQKTDQLVSQKLAAVQARINKDMWSGSTVDDTKYQQVTFTSDYGSAGSVDSKGY